MCLEFPVNLKRKSKKELLVTQLLWCFDVFIKQRSGGEKIDHLEGRECPLLSCHVLCRINVCQYLFVINWSKAIGFQNTLFKAFNKKWQILIVICKEVHDMSNLKRLYVSGLQKTGNFLNKNPDYSMQNNLLA